MPSLSACLELVEVGHQQVWIKHGCLDLLLGGCKRNAQVSLLDVGVVEGEGLASSRQQGVNSLWSQVQSPRSKVTCG